MIDSKYWTDSALQAEMVVLRAKLAQLMDEEQARGRISQEVSLQRRREADERAWYDRHKNDRLYRVDSTNSYYVWAKTEKAAMERVGASMVQTRILAEPASASHIPAHRFPLFIMDSPKHWGEYLASIDYEKKLADLRKKYEDAPIP